MSTPKGRQRYREMLNQTSPTMSPSRHSRAAASLSTKLVDIMKDQEDVDMDMGMDLDEDDEDEETLQLKLQEIQARLKLKRLQNAKAKGSATEQRRNDRAPPDSAPSSFNQPRRAVRMTTPTAEENPRPPPVQNYIQVPASPIRKLQEPMPQTSPQRVLLGIDKGLKGKDISLKRAPSLRRSRGADGAAPSGGYLQTSKQTNPARAESAEPFRPRSFNERLAAVRTEEASRTEREQRVKQLRSSAFAIGKDELEEYKNNAVEIPDEPIRAPTFSREQIMSNTQPGPGSLHRSNTAPSVRSSFGSSQQNDHPMGETPEGAVEEQASFEPYSSFHLTKRILPHRVIARHVSGKKVFNIKDLLKIVKAPDFALPDIEQDIVVFAIVGKKSEPRAHKPTTVKSGVQAEDRGKYMVMTLVDLDYELDLFLFNTGFTRFWKLTEGTVVAILNPNIMPPPPGRQDTGRFSLVINSDEDTILEIGSARDLGFCQSVKKDGQLCSSWINKKRTQYCEFHSNEAVRKQRSTRMEVNSTGFGGRKNNSKEVFAFGKNTKTNNYDHETKSHWFVSRSQTAADLLDGRDRTPADRKERAEVLRRNLEAKEKERELMKKLGQIGNAAGRDYMRRGGGDSHVSNTVDSSTASSQIFDSSMTGPERPEVASLGLDSRDRTIHLSPVKRKRTGGSQTSSLAGSTTSSRAGTAYGWGSTLKDKLTSMKEGEKQQQQQQQRKDELPPLRKKTRFVTDKGIREAGRESLCLDLAERQITFEDDDDDLIIVR